MHTPNTCIYAASLFLCPSAAHSTQTHAQKLEYFFRTVHAAEQAAIVFVMVLFENSSAEDMKTPLRRISREFRDDFLFEHLEETWEQAMHLEDTVFISASQSLVTAVTTTCGTLLTLPAGLGGGGAARQYHVPRSGFMTDKSAEDFWLETAFSWFNLLEKLAGFRSDLRGRLDLWKTGVGAGGTYMDSARATRINKYFG